MLIVNPNAGKGQYKNCLAEVLGVFCYGGYIPTVFYTSRPGNAGEILAEYLGATKQIV